MRLSEILDTDRLSELIEQQYITCNRHEVLPLRILNYSKTTQFENHWTPETLQCRGLIVDDDDNVIARPFPKFFSLDQHQAVFGRIPLGTYEIQEKLDGSLIIIARYEDQVIVSTRGSFYSPQAKLAQQFFNDMRDGFYVAPNTTYLFELIQAGREVVVEYDHTDLVWLDSLDNVTHNTTYEVNYWPGSVRRTFNLDTPVDELVNEVDPTEEGFVLFYPRSQQRIKIKGEVYKRLHRARTHLSPLRVWEALSEDRFLELIKVTPDEFYPEVIIRSGSILSWYLELETEIRKTFDSIYPGATDRKSFALSLSYLNEEWRPVLWHMYDGKDYSKNIWKMVRPKGNEMFGDEDV